MSSVSAMVFMADSERAAELAKANNLRVGLHLNFTEQFTGDGILATLGNYQKKIASFLTRNRYSQVFYNPRLRREFAHSCQAQLEEFTRLFGRRPLHVDGHHHMHLCANLLLANLIPAGMKVRRNFSFLPGEKSWLNRSYRTLVDRWLARRYRVTDYFFDLTQSIQEQKINRVLALAAFKKVELMTHPILQLESEYLMSNQFRTTLLRLSVVP